MRYKEHTLSKLDAQATKLKTLQRQISMANITGPDAIAFIDTIIKEISLVVERISLEPNE